MAKKIQYTNKQMLDWLDKNGQAVVAFYNNTQTQVEGWYQFAPLGVRSYAPGRQHKTIRDAIQAAMSEDKRLKRVK